tara:strand:+ start:1278 stop:1808 length:531 start_codon:yes stop_codon:yes gene_type:complete
VKKLSDFIRQYENLIDTKLCNKIVNQKDLSFYPATEGDGKLNTHRNCYDKPLEDEFNDDIFQIIGKVLNLYRQDQPWFLTGARTEDTGYTHLLYLGSKKGEYKEHIDNSDTNPRVLSCSLILNDNYEGGDFAFFGGEYIVPKKAGSAVVFPSNFCFPHAILPITEGDRHAIITWIH